MIMVQDNGSSLRGELRFDEPMSRHTSWRTGGPVRRWYRPADTQDLAEFLRTLPTSEALYWVGLGSNLLVRDGGIAGTVISTYGAFPDLLQPEPLRVRAGAGVACAKVARFCAARGLTGGEFLVGVPGTIGGALAMNAGAFGGSTWEQVVEVETMDRFGARHTRLPAEYQVGYRQVDGPGNEWFTAACLQFESGDSTKSQFKIKELLAQRGRTQPTQQASCGSVFRNPPGDYAARLIESAGLKGSCIGGACVSEMHANFIVNTGDATSEEIEALIHKVQREVERRRGVRLELEVHIVGEHSPATASVLQ